ncbi:MAG: hypothetical protein ACYC3H_01535 [Bellilinea sp.]
MTIIDDVCSGINVVGASAPGITRAFNPPPVSIETAHLPALYAFLGSANHNETAYGPNMVLTTRTYRVQVAVIPTGQGNPNTRELQIRPLLQNVIEHYRKYPRLSRTNRVREARVVSDSGIVILPEWGGKFIGFEIRLAVTTLEPRAYQGE